jgi:hypothetical protein
VLSKFKALSSNHTTVNKKKKKDREREKEGRKGERKKEGDAKVNPNAKNKTLFSQNFI